MTEREARDVVMEYLNESALRLFTMPNGPDYEREDKLVEALLVLMPIIFEHFAERARARGTAPHPPAP